VYHSVAYKAHVNTKRCNDISSYRDTLGSDTVSIHILVVSIYRISWYIDVSSSKCILLHKINVVVVHFRCELFSSEPLKIYTWLYRAIYRYNIIVINKWQYIDTYKLCIVTSPLASYNIYNLALAIYNRMHVTNIKTQLP